MIAGPVIGVAFAVCYGIISFFLSYYGEMITYLGMTAPMSLASIITWLRNPSKEEDVVKVSRMTKKQVGLMALFATLVTVAFFFILRALGNDELIPSTISITTSFVAVYFSMMRSPFYALAYACNDIVLIVLWVAATLKNISYFPMVLCFVIFLLFDLYGFYNWKKLQKSQQE
ncbi:MAG: nicotinamide mononucleotide transporter [Clostridia bacterium]|nr:nicotinamide mononucleotide transporter [Clostridia bacterium]